MKEKLKKLIKFFVNPHLLICVAAAWFITNGWSYVGFGLGTLLNWPWLYGVSGAYLAFLWFPFTPEKILTAAISIWLLKVLFPNDKKTLAVLKELKANALARHKANKERRKEKKKK